jgi:hypothetical protein
MLGSDSMKTIPSCRRIGMHCCGSEPRIRRALSVLGIRLESVTRKRDDVEVQLGAARQDMTVRDTGSLAPEKRDSVPDPGPSAKPTSSPVAQPKRTVGDQVKRHPAGLTQVPDQR